MISSLDVDLFPTSFSTSKNRKDNGIKAEKGDAIIEFRLVSKIKTMIGYFCIVLLY